MADHKTQYFDYHEVLDEEAFRQLLPLFVREVQSTLHQLEQKSSPEDNGSIQAAAHKLCGTSSSFGATLVNQAARDLESLIKSEAEASEINAHMDRLRQNIQVTVEFAIKEYQL